MKKYKIIYEKNNTKKHIYIKAKDKFEAQNKALKLRLKILDIQICVDNFRIKNINEEKMILFFNELSLLCEVGFSVSQALNELIKTSDKNLKENIQNLIFSLNNGKSLSVAFEILKLNQSEIALIKTAQNTGGLDKIFKQISFLKQKNLKNKKQINKALQYPIFVLFSAFFAFVFLMLFVVGEFKIIFDEFNGDLPLITKIMIFSYEFLDNYFLYLLICFFAFILSTLFFYKKNHHFAYVFDGFCLKIPFVKKIIFYNQNYYFFMIFSLLLNGGVSTMQALNLASASIKNKFLSKKYEQILLFLKQGLEFDKAFDRVNIFDKAVISMLFVASKSARLDQICEQISKYYESKQEQFMDKFLSLLEPFLTLIVAILVLFLALGIFLPMWELSSIKN